MWWNTFWLGNESQLYGDCVGFDAFVYLPTKFLTIKVVVFSISLTPSLPFDKYLWHFNLSDVIEEISPTSGWDYTLSVCPSVHLVQMLGRCSGVVGRRRGRGRERRRTHSGSGREQNKLHLQLVENTDSASSLDFYSRSVHACSVYSEWVLCACACLFIPSTNSNCTGFEINGCAFTQVLLITTRRHFHYAT